MTRPSKEAQKRILFMQRAKGDTAETLLDKLRRRFIIEIVLSSAGCSISLTDADAYTYRGQAKSLRGAITAALKQWRKAVV